ncbi:MAG: hypothetical protein ACP5UQ_01330 [Anaerolineae bacterium]
MELIDWPGVARNALWILGLSIVLAAWSHSRWWAAVHGVKLRRMLDWPRVQAPVSAGLLLFCVSLAWSATRGWERGLWILLGLSFAWQLISAWRLAARGGWDAAPEAPNAAPSGKVGQ